MSILTKFPSSAAPLKRQSVNSLLLAKPAQFNAFATKRLK